MSSFFLPSFLLPFFLPSFLLPFLRRKSAPNASYAGRPISPAFPNPDPSSPASPYHRMPVHACGARLSSIFHPNFISSSQSYVLQHSLPPKHVYASREMALQRVCGTSTWSYLDAGRASGRLAPGAPRHSVNTETLPRAPIVVALRGISALRSKSRQLGQIALRMFQL